MAKNEVDQAEMTRLFTAHQMQMRAYAYTICRDTHLAEDIIQETAVVLITKFDAYDPARPFLPWALRITRNKALDMLRKRGKVVLVSDASALDCLEDSFVREGEADIMDARLGAMMACVAEVGGEGREILGMKYVKRMSVRDIAYATRRRIVAVNSLLQRLRERVRDCVNRRMAEAT